MRALRTALLSTLFVSFLPNAGTAQVVRITYTGTLSSGFDAGGIFGSPRSDLKGKAFSVIFAFDLFRGKQTGPTCTGQNCISDISGYYGTSPGTATLQIGDRSYTFGTAIEPGANSNLAIRSYARRIIQIIPSMNYRLFRAEAGAMDYLSNIGLGTIIIKDPLPTIDPNWQAPVCLTNIPSDSGAGGTFSIKTSNGETQGGLAADSMSIGDGCPAAQLPTVEILWNGKNVANTVQPVVVGQQIQLTGRPSAAGGTPVWSIVQSEGGTLPQGAVVGGYFPGNVKIPGIARKSTLDPVHLDQTQTTFYFVEAGSTGRLKYVVTYKPNPAQALSAQVIFDVAGPTAPEVTVRIGSVKVASMMFTNTHRFATGLFLGNLSADAFFFDPFIRGLDINEIGISFSGAVIQPPIANGSLTWVQIIKSIDQLFKGRAPTTISARNELDASYPHRSKKTLLGQQYTNDAPGVILDSVFSQVMVSESFNTYLMWTPELEHSIPVPLGFVSWQWSGAATNSPTDGWGIKDQAACTEGYQPFQRSIEYPMWDGVRLPPPPKK